jgi:protocatechuate 4,5-dioxygenase alpha chain
MAGIARNLFTAFAEKNFGREPVRGGANSPSDPEIVSVRSKRTSTNHMALDKPYKDIPGTTIFDADQARRGYHLNQFCMSLMKAENRERFKANERAYLDEWPMTEDQKQAVLARDLNRCISLGGNIYFLAKIGATDGRSFQFMAASMTGMTQEEYAQMMLKGGRSAKGNKSGEEK